MVPALCIALAGVSLLMLFWRRHLGSLMQVASLIAGVLLLIWLQDNGYLRGGGARPGYEDNALPSARAR